MNLSAKAKEIFAAVKAIFDAPIVPAATAAAKVYKTKDGVELSITTAGEKPVVGEIVMNAGAPAIAGTWELEDGTMVTTDATGAIVTWVDPAPVTKTPEELAAEEAARVAAQVPVVLTAEAVQAMFAKFATGTPEERIANLELMCKALMECNFGYELRKGQEAAAIQAYKDSIAPVQQSVTTATAAMAAAEAKVVKQDEIITGMFELLTELMATPTTTPVTLTGVAKERFEKQQGREQKFEKLGAALSELRNKKKKNPAVA